MKVYINMRDLLTWPKAMAETLATQGHEVILVDNNSTYEPLLDYYSKCPHTVLACNINTGPLAPWFYIDHNEEFAVTDPDLDISSIPADWPEVLREGRDRNPRGSKCGFSLDDSKVPMANPAYFLDDFKSYPEGGHPLTFAKNLEVPGKKCVFYRYPTDTTFALYSPGEMHSITGWRSGAPYMARHLPWHVVLDISPEKRQTFQIPMNDEIYYYFSHARYPDSTTMRRLQSMVQQYAERRK